MGFYYGFWVNVAAKRSDIYPSQSTQGHLVGGRKGVKGVRVYV